MRTLQENQGRWTSCEEQLLQHGDSTSSQMIQLKGALALILTHARVSLIREHICNAIRGHVQDDVNSKKDKTVARIKEQLLGKGVDKCKSVHTAIRELMQCK